MVDDGGQTNGVKAVLVLSRSVFFLNSLSLGSLLGDDGLAAHHSVLTGQEGRLGLVFAQRVGGSGRIVQVCRGIGEPVEVGDGGTVGHEVVGLWRWMRMRMRVGMRVCLVMGMQVAGVSVQGSQVGVRASDGVGKGAEEG